MKKTLSRGGILQRILVLLMLAWFCLFLVLPIFMMFGQVFSDDMGNWVGLANFSEYFGNPLLASSILHSLYVSLLTAFVSTGVGFLFAYGISRTCMHGKSIYRYLIQLPLFLPTMVHGMALIYIFGRTGFVTSILGIDIGLYGKTGIILAEIFYTLPQAYMILSVALDQADNRLYEAARVMDVSPAQIFLRVTLPAVRYGVINAFIVCFTLSFTDFGAPAVVGGSYNVLATDIYRQVVGQQKMSMGAVVGVLLTIPALLAFFLDLAMKKKNDRNELSSKAVAFHPERSAARDRFYQCFCSLISACVLLLLLSVVLSAIVKRWPYDLSLTLDHFNFGEKLLGSGTVSFLNSARLALGTAVLGTVFVFCFAYLIEKLKTCRRLRALARFLAMMPMALPGLVLGLGYIMFFNKKWFEIGFLHIAVENPLAGMYGTFSIMIFCTIVHLFSVTFVTASTALKKLDREYENVAESLDVPFWQVFFRVSLPISLDAVLEVFLYYFVNSMVTVSAIVFLYTTKTRPAAIAILNMDDNGDYASAAAMSILILLINIAVRIIGMFLKRSLSGKLGGWRQHNAKA